MAGYPVTMRALSIELEDDLVAALEAERKLFGFESRQAYVRWILEHRGSIEAEQGSGGGDVDETTRSPTATGETGATAAASHPDEPNTPSGAATTDEGDGAGSTLEVRGSPRTIRRGPGSTDCPDESEATAGREPPADDGHGTTTPREATPPDAAGDHDESVSATLTPERVARIREDPVHEDAGVLGSVEAERLDELSRRAVATTRKRLDREVQTGLEYASSTRLAGDGVQPGEDIADLDALSVPGRSDETLEKRRRAVGRALALLRDEGRARRSAFVEALYAECPAGYETSDGWWECIKTGFKQVESVDGGDGSRVWEFRG